MNSTSLFALIVDQHSGELAPEVVELLEAYLAENADACAEAERIRNALSVTEEAVLRHPELARVEALPAPHSRASLERRRFDASWLAKVASITLFAGITAAGGFLVGQKNPSVTAVAPSVHNDSVRPPRKDSPWARYRVASDRGGGGMQIVRMGSAKETEGALQ